MTATHTPTPTISVDTMWATTAHRPPDEARTQPGRSDHYWFLAGSDLAELALTAVVLRVRHDLIRGHYRAHLEATEIRGRALDLPVPGAPALPVVVRADPRLTRPDHAAGSRPWPITTDTSPGRGPWPVDPDTYAAVQARALDLVTGPDLGGMWVTTRSRLPDLTHAGDGYAAYYWLTPDDQADDYGFRPAVALRILINPTQPSYQAILDNPQVAVSSDRVHIVADRAGPRRTRTVIAERVPAGISPSGLRTFAAAALATVTGRPW